MDNISFLNKTSKGVKLNIFAQETEPTIKNGIWIKTATNKNIKFVRILPINLSQFIDTDIILPISFVKGQASVINNDLWIVYGTYVYSYNFITKTWTKHSDLPYSASCSSYGGFGNTLQHDDEYLYIPAPIESSLRVMKYKMSDGTCVTKTFGVSKNADSAGLCLMENGDLYWIGWQTVSAITEANIAYRYGMAKLNFEAGNYNIKTHVPTTHCYGENIVPVGNNIYLIGSANAVTSKPMENSRCIYVYDTLNDTYTHIYTSDINIHVSSSVVYKDKIICMLQSQGKILVIHTNDNSVELLDIDIPTTLTYGQLAVYNNELLIVGGTDNTNGVKTASISMTDIVHDTVYIFNPEHNAKLYLKLINNSNIITGVDDVVYINNGGNIDKTIPIYYGNGTEWIEISNT